MTELVQFALLGLGQGSLVAGLAIALVLFYRGSGVINLATGAIAMVTGFCFWAFRTGELGPEVATVPALGLALLVALIQGLLMELVAFRPLRSAPPLAKLIATLGFLLAAQAGVILVFGHQDRSLPAILPAGTIRLLGTPVDAYQLILAGGVCVLAAALWTIYRWTGFGIRTRAAAESEVSAMYLGLFPQTPSLVNTLLGAATAGMLGVLAGPLVQLNTTKLPLLIVPALCAALFARFTSFGIACVLGLALGSLQNVIFYLTTLSWFPTTNGAPIGGVYDVVVFLLVVLATYWLGDRLPQRGDLVEQRLPDVPRTQNARRWALIALAVGVAALTVVPYGPRQALMTSIIGVALALSLVVITGFVGQVSVVQLALSGATGLIMSQLATKAGIGFPFAPIIAVLFTTAFGVVIAVGALRVRGVQLAVVTLAAVVAISNFWIANPTWGSQLTGAPIDQPSLFGFDLGNTAGFRGLDGQAPSPVLGYGLVVLSVLAGLFVVGLRRSSLGRRMLAVRSNERAAASVGINVARVKIAAFAISSALAGVAGVMYGYNFSSVSGTRFSAITAFTLIAYAYIGGITMVSGATLAGLFATGGLAEYALTNWLGVSGVWLLLFGGCAVLVSAVLVPDGIAGGLRRRYLARRRARTPASAGVAPVAATPALARSGSPEGCGGP